MQASLSSALQSCNPSFQHSNRESEREVQPGSPVRPESLALALCHALYALFAFAKEEIMAAFYLAPLLASCGGSDPRRRRWVDTHLSVPTGQSDRCRVKQESSIGRGDSTSGLFSCRCCASGDRNLGPRPAWPDAIGRPVLIRENEFHL